MVRLLLIILSVFVLSCTDNRVEPLAPFSVEQESLELDDLGGDFKIYYHLDFESAINAVAICDAEWITDIDNKDSLVFPP